MALSLDDLTAKVDNGGVTPDGLLTAEEYNTLLAAVKENAENSTDEHIGSVVVDNTLSALNLESKKPVDSQGIAGAIKAASNSLKERGYIYMGVATPTTTPDVSGGKVFYLAAQAGEYNNFGITLPTDALTSLEWNGERWFAIRIADLVTPAEVEQAILDNTAKKIEKGEAKPVASGVVAEALEARDKQLENKADKTEYYPDMAVGIADNLRGRGEAKEEIYTYRPSAGASNSISEEGVATIKRIKGNTIVWNQLADISNLLRIDFSENTDVYSLSIGRFNKAIKITEGHKYIGTGYVETNINTPVSFGISGSMKEGVIITSSGTGYYGKIFEAVRDKTSDMLFVNNYKGQRGFLQGDYISCTLNFFDLTQMFGAGNEPTTVEEFKALFPKAYYEYNGGELVSMTSNGLFTNGFNQWDEKWVLGEFQNGSLISGNRICSKNFIKIVPNQVYAANRSLLISLYDSEKNFIPYDGNGDFPAYRNLLDFNLDVIREGKFPIEAEFIKFRLYSTYNSTTYENDACINLSHSGVRDGEYEPYEEHTQDLSEIARYFPDGMRSVGGAFDEINEREAVQRVGQRAYAEGDNDNPAVMTDGVNTIYPLDTPIVTPMSARAINLNYPVWDWGTERAVSDVPSAPFRADIIYGFNAVDTIRTNKLDIEALILRVADLEAKIAETSTTTMEEEML